MLSGLYGDLPEAKNNASAPGSGGGWAQKPKFAPPVRKPTLGAPRSVLGPAKKRPRDATSDGALSTAFLRVSACCLAMYCTKRSMIATFSVALPSQRYCRGRTDCHAPSLRRS